MNNLEEQDPEGQDCCGSGCNPCILDVRKKLLEQKESIPSKNALDQSKYVKFVISQIKEMAEEYLIVVLKLKDPVEEDVGIKIKIGQYVIIRILNVSRSLTPISWSSNDFTILAKIYKDGHMSKLLKERKIGDEMDIRGPYGDFMYHRNSIGSGIAAMYPIINSIILDDSENSRLELNASFRYYSTVPLKDELRLLAKYWNFSCTLFLTQENNSHILTGIKLVNNVRINENKIKEILNNCTAITTLILICGTKEFNKMAQLAVNMCNFTNYYIFD